MGMIKKIVIISILSCTGGAGLFLGKANVENSFAFFNSGDHSVAKKKLLVKPKSFYSNRRSKKVDEFKYEQLSFFPVLADPSLNKIMGLNGHFIEKISYSPPVDPVVRVSKPKKKVRAKISAPVPPAKIENTSMSIPTSASAVAEKNKAVVRQEQLQTLIQILKGLPVLSAHGDKEAGSVPVASKSAPSIEISTMRTLKPAGSPPPAMVSYVVQVSSFRTIERAEILKAELDKKGYASFVGQTILPNNKGTWYRVNIGRYLNHAGAEKAAEKYFRTEKHKAMVIRKSG